MVDRAEEVGNVGLKDKAFACYETGPELLHGVVAERLGLKP